VLQQWKPHAESLIRRRPKAGAGDARTSARVMDDLRPHPGKSTIFTSSLVARTNRRLGFAICDSLASFYHPPANTFLRTFVTCHLPLEGFTMPGGIVPPLSVLLSFPSPNYVDPPRHGRGLLAGVVVLTTCSTLTVCARLWARFGAQKNGGVDDILIAVAMVRNAPRWLDCGANLARYLPLGSGFCWDWVRYPPHSPS
jgi:hypothetical protein